MGVVNLVRALCFSDSFLTTFDFTIFSVHRTVVAQCQQIDPLALLVAYGAALETLTRIQCFRISVSANGC